VCVGDASLVNNFLKSSPFKHTFRRKPKDCLAIASL
jgi:hypothetical protein